MIPSAPEEVISWLARAYVVGLTRRERFASDVDFCLRCERDGYRVGWPLGLPLPYQIAEAEAKSRAVLHPVRRSGRGLLRTLRAAL